MSGESFSRQDVSERGSDTGKNLDVNANNPMFGNFDDMALRQVEQAQNVDMMQADPQEASERGSRSPLDTLRDVIDEKIVRPREFRQERVKARLDRVPKGDRVEWTGEIGDSLCKPTDDRVKRTLAEYGQEGVRYKDGVTDLSPFAKETVRIDNMTEDISKNYGQAYGAVAEKWNAEARDGRTDWTARDVREWKQENNLEMHECNDMRTCMFVPAEVHEYFSHAGGRSEVKALKAYKEGGNA